MKNNYQTPENHPNTTLNVLTGLLVGGLAGAITTLLLAPQSGVKTRMLIQEKSIELRDQTLEMVDGVIAQVRADGKQLTSEGRQKAKELIHQGQELVIEQLEHVTEAVRAGESENSTRTI